MACKRHFLLKDGKIMKYAFVFIMIFGAAVILYGFIMSRTGDIKMIPYRRRYSAKMNDTKAYVKQLGKLTSIIGFSPLAAGATGALFENGIAAGIVFVLTLIVCIVICAKIYKEL